MASTSTLLCFLLLAICTAASGLTAAGQRRLWAVGQQRVTSDYDLPAGCVVKQYEQRVDHFNAKNGDRFQQRYVLCQKAYRSGGPIFFYTGNEGDIMFFVKTAGFLFDAAPEFGAAVVFAEHRYYGKSMPSDRGNFTYLSVAQVLADFNAIIPSLKSSGGIPHADNSPVILFGGSYGGMLAAWMRMKYPGTVDGAIAASAPIWGFQNLAPCDYYQKITTRDYEAQSPYCRENIRNSWNALGRLSLTAAGRKAMGDELHLCGNYSHGFDLDVVKQWLSDSWLVLAMIDYPYPVDLPAWPVNKVCSHLNKEIVDDEHFLPALYHAISVVYNSTGHAGPCYNLENGADRHGLHAWTYQTCSELVMPHCANGVTDMFEPQAWNFDAWTRMCKARFGDDVQPQEFFAQSMFGGTNILSFSNIVFSNGNLDPWSGAGVLGDIASDSLETLYIIGGAHHLDLRYKNTADPQSVKDARNKEKQAIRKWIVTAQQKRA